MIWNDFSASQYKLWLNMKLCYREGLDYPLVGFIILHNKSIGISELSYTNAKEQENTNYSFQKLLMESYQCV